MFCLQVPLIIFVSVRDLHISRIDLPILLQGNMLDRSWEYINCSQTHEWGNWDWGRAVPRRGIHKWDFPCSAGSVFVVCFRRCHGPGSRRIVVVAAPGAPPRRSSELLSSHRSLHFAAFQTCGCMVPDEPGWLGFLHLLEQDADSLHGLLAEMHCKFGSIQYQI